MANQAIESLKLCKLCIFTIIDLFINRLKNLYKHTNNVVKYKICYGK